MNNKATILIVIVLALVATAYSAAFVVDETEQVVLTRFGKIVRKPITTPGLNFRIPFIDTVNKYPKNLQQWDGDPGQIPTLEIFGVFVDGVYKRNSEIQTGGGNGLPYNFTEAGQNHLFGFVNDKSGGIGRGHNGQYDRDQNSGFIVHLDAPAMFFKSG